MSENWIAGATKNKGALHKKLGVPVGEKIPEAKIAKAASAGGVLGKEAHLAQTLKGMGKGRDMCQNEEGKECPLPVMAASNCTYTKPLADGSDPRKAFGGAKG